MAGPRKRVLEDINHADGIPPGEPLLSSFREENEEVAHELCSLETSVEEGDDETSSEPMDGEASSAEPSLQEEAGDARSQEASLEELDGGGEVRNLETSANASEARSLDTSREGADGEAQSSWSEVSLVRCKDPTDLRSNMRQFREALECIFQKYSQPTENCVELDLTTMQYDTPCGPRKWLWNSEPRESIKCVPISTVTNPSKTSKEGNLTLPVNQLAIIDEVPKEPVTSDIHNETYSVSSDGEERSYISEEEEQIDIAHEEEQHNLAEKEVNHTVTLGPIDTQVKLAREPNNATVSARKTGGKEMSSDIQHEHVKHLESQTCPSYIFNVSTSGAFERQFTGSHESLLRSTDGLFCDNSFQLSNKSYVKESGDSSSQLSDELSDSEFSNLTIGLAYPKLVESINRHVVAPLTMQRARKIRKSYKRNGWFSNQPHNISNIRMNNSTIFKTKCKTNRESKLIPYRSEKDPAAHRIVKQCKVQSTSHYPGAKLLTENISMCNEGVGQNAPKPSALSKADLHFEDTYFKEGTSVPRIVFSKTFMQRENLNDTFIKSSFGSQNADFMSNEHIQAGHSTPGKKTKGIHVPICSIVRYDTVDIPHFINMDTLRRTRATFSTLRKSPLKGEENVSTFEQIYRKLRPDIKSESPRFVRHHLISRRLEEMEPSETVCAMMSSPMFSKVKRKSDFHDDESLTPNIKRTRTFTSSGILNCLFNGMRLDPQEHTCRHSKLFARSNLEACYSHNSPHRQSSMKGRCHLPIQTSLSPCVRLPAAANADIFDTVPSVIHTFNSLKRQHSPNASVSRKLNY